MEGKVGEAFLMFNQDVSRLQITLKNRALISYRVLTFELLRNNKVMLKCGFYSNMRTFLSKIEITKK